MSKQVTHTPVPWIVIHTHRKVPHICGADPSNGGLIARCDTQATQEIKDANAEFIVRACNAHDELLAACKALLKAYRLARAQVFGTDAVEEAARAAIAKAGE